MKKGQVSIFLIAMVMIIVMLIIFAFILPANALILTQLTKGAEAILANTNEGLANIGDSEIREAVNDSILSAKAAGNSNFEVNLFLYQWGWVFLLAIVILVLFILLNIGSTQRRTGLA